MYIQSIPIIPTLSKLSVYSLLPLYRYEAVLPCFRSFSATPRHLEPVRSFRIEAHTIYASLSSEFAHGSESCPVEVKPPHTQDADNTEATEEACASGEPHVSVERMCKQNTATSQGAAEEVIGSEQRRGIARIAEGHVEKDALQDDEYRSCVKSDAESRHDPVNGAPRRPSEGEKTKCRPKRSWQSGQEGLLLRSKA